MSHYTILGLGASTIPRSSNFRHFKPEAYQPPHIHLHLHVDHSEQGRGCKAEIHNKSIPCIEALEMLTPTILNVVLPFYAVGDSPAVTLTRNVPQGVDADILLLGSGDVRHILYTAYHEKGLRESCDPAGHE